MSQSSLQIHHRTRSHNDIEKWPTLNWEDAPYPRSAPSKISYCPHNKEWTYFNCMNYNVYASLFDDAKRYYGEQKALFYCFCEIMRHLRNYWFTPLFRQLQAQRLCEACEHGFEVVFASSDPGQDGERELTEARQNHHVLVSTSGGPTRVHNLEDHDLQALPQCFTWRRHLQNRAKCEKIWQSSCRAADN
jgi:hypothetical protein